MRVEGVPEVGVVLSIDVGVAVGENVGLVLSVGETVPVIVSVGVRGIVGVSVNVSVGVSVVPTCCAGTFAGAAYTLFPTIMPNMPPARSTVVKTRRKDFLSRSINGMIASRQ